MGGYGSGKYEREQRAERTAERCSLDVRKLRRQGNLEPGTVFRVKWNSGGIGVLHGLSEGGQVLLSNQAEPSQVPGAEVVACAVALDWTPCHFGGWRPWFVCSCGERCARIYQDGRRFACRSCCGLTYAVQSQDDYHRSLRHLRKAARRVGGSGSILDPPSRRPKGMHHATYLRRQWEVIDATNRVTLELNKDFEKTIAFISRRFGI